MDIKTSPGNIDTTCWVTVSGDLDLSNVETLNEALRTMQDAGFVHLVVDLGAVAFIDSTGFGVLVEAMRRSRTTGGDVGLVVKQTHVKRVMEITGLDRVFVTSDTPEDVEAQLIVGVQADNS